MTLEEITDKIVKLLEDQDFALVDKQSGGHIFFDTTDGKHYEIIIEEF